ncbi:MAG: hypothetical protein C0595_06375 [Marinilabiliales bacterium]|nr:MAG: hypothetical protein C0595_06375 [Marinilabiliales bacterium]
MLLSCNNNNENHSHDTINGHAHETEALSYTLFSNGYELFVEFPALTVGHTSTFTAHFTQLTTYKPVLEGKLTVSIIKDNKGIKHSVDSPDSPGIFKPALQPKQAGTYKLLFELVSSTGNVTFKIPQVQVYSNAEEASNILEENNEDEISFLKEQAWKTEFSTQEVKFQPFYSVIHTSAKVKEQPQSAVLVNSEAEGQINLFVTNGKSIKKGELLAIVTSSGFENNITTKLKESKIAFEKSKTDFVRTKPLAKDQIISQKDFLQIEYQYKQDSLRYYQLANQITQKGLQIMSPIDGFISGINISNGQFVNNGTAVLEISNSNKLIIEAYVNQSDFQLVNGIFDANFAFADGDKKITLQEINGKIISKNTFIGEKETRIPVSFSAVNNGKLMLGMFLEAFLKTGKKEKSIVLPLSALIEEQVKFYVFVQTGGESYEKRQVEISKNDGILTEIESGLSVGERVVTKGAYQIKLAALAGDLPIHGHTH